MKSHSSQQAKQQRKEAFSSVSSGSSVFTVTTQLPAATSG
jgi:hypothetical protein